MSGNRWCHLSAAGALMLLLASCSDAGAPTSTPSASPVVAVNASANSMNGDIKAEHERLKDLLKQLKDSLKAEGNFHREEYRLAKQQWKAWFQEWKRAKKLGGLPTLLSCEPQEYTSDADLIGPEGGTLKVGEHELTIPAGALDHEVLISAVAPVSNNAEVQLQPEGLRFARPAVLKLSYTKCVQPPSWINLFIVYLSNDGLFLDVTVSADKKGVQAVYGKLEHFSRYAVAW